VSLLRDHQGLTDGKFLGVVGSRNLRKVAQYHENSAYRYAWRGRLEVTSKQLDPTREVILGSSEQPKLRTHLDRVFGGLPKRIARFRTRIGRRAKMQRIAPEQ
jgi:hypothetical protein